uniref:Uncharacterized protein n=1 Tax=Romanomermis culicivorax TaxID=13658 RepID=A0A915K3N8_ROMCU
MAPSDQDLRHKDHVSFRKAGQGPLIPTYSYNPKEKFKEAFEMQRLEKKARFGPMGRYFGKFFGS